MSRSTDAEFYILGGKDEHEAIPSDELSWMQWYATADKHVAHDIVGRATVSTIFLGIDLDSWGPPRLFETMVFGGANDQFQARYSTWEDAVRGHRAAVELEKQCARPS
jgi:hypothetical protein